MEVKRGIKESENCEEKYYIGWYITIITVEAVGPPAAALG